MPRPSIPRSRPKSTSSRRGAEGGAGSEGLQSPGSALELEGYSLLASFGLDWYGVFSQHFSSDRTYFAMCSFTVQLKVLTRLMTVCIYTHNKYLVQPIKGNNKQCRESSQNLVDTDNDSMISRNSAGKRIKLHNISEHAKHATLPCPGAPSRDQDRRARPAGGGRKAEQAVKVSRFPIGTRRIFFTC